MEPGTFISSEFVRTATLGRSVTVSDSETLSKYVLQPDGTVEGVQRVALYLTPNPNNQEGAMYFETNGRSVAEFMYKFSMKQVGGGCVTTPKGVEQCIGGEAGGPSYRRVDDEEDDGDDEAK